MTFVTLRCNIAFKVIWRKDIDSKTKTTKQLKEELLVKDKQANILDEGGNVVLF